MSGSDLSSVLELERIFPGDSEIAARMRAIDWARSDLGPPASWAPNLRIALSICLTSHFPILLWWGPRLTLLYNDATIPFLGETKHPHVLARPGQACWPEIWDTISPLLEEVRATGRATWSEDLGFFLARSLPREEVYIQFTYGPILAADGQTVDGIFTPCTETTDQVIAARRLETLRLLGVQAAAARTVEAAGQGVAAVLAESARDIPFAAVYVVDEQGMQATLAATAGLTTEADLLPPAVSLTAGEASPWPLAAVLRTQHPEVMDLAALGQPFPGGPWPDPAATALVLPIMADRNTLAGMLIAGVSSRRSLDATYRTFFDLVARHIGTAIAQARAADELRRVALRREEEVQAAALNVLESMAEGFMAFDAEWRIIYFNAGAEQDSRTPRAEVLGRNYWEAFPLVVGTPLEREFRHVMADRVPQRLENLYAPFDQWFEMTISPVQDGGIAVYGHDVTARKRAEEAVRQSEIRFRALFRNSRDAILIADDNSIYVDANPAAAALFGLPAEQLVGQSLYDFVATEHNPSATRLWQEFIDAGFQQGEFEIRRLDGQRRVLEYSAVANILPGQHLSIIRDISERKRAEEALRESERRARDELEERVRQRTAELAAATNEADRQRQRLHDIVMQIPAVVGVLAGPEHRWELGNPTFLRSMNRREEDVIGKSIREVFPEAKEQGWVEVADQVYRSGEPRVAYEALAWLDRQGDGHLEETYWNSVMVPLRNADGQVESIMTHGVEVTNQVLARRRIERLLREREEEIARRNEVAQELHTTNQRLRELSARLLEVQEAERRTIARELHDEIGQYLTGLRFMLEAAEKAAPPQPDLQLASALAVVDDLTTRVRELSLGLRPSMLDDSGLIPALLWHIERYTEQTGIEVILGHQGLDTRLPVAIETAVYRIIQEALTNVARHAAARQATVQIQVTQQVTVLVEDAGQGFDVSAALARHASTGLSGMRERAELLGGQLLIESNSGGGTRVLAEIPLGDFQSAPQQGPAAGPPERADQA